MKAKPVKILTGHGYVQCSIAEATHLTLHLPGPTGIHTLPVMIKGSREGTGNWTWNGDIEKPTLKPSVLVMAGHFAPNFRNGDACWCTYYKNHPEETPLFHCFLCHTWINDGMAQFLSDSSHELSDKTVELLDVPND